MKRTKILVKINTLIYHIKIQTLIYHIRKAINVIRAVIPINVMNKICDGCLSYERDKENPDAFDGGCRGYKIKDISCPCRNCIVKSMCNEDCEELDKRFWY